MNIVKLPKNYKIKKIKEIKFDYSTPTYDVEVENSHHYILDNNLICHNTLSLMFRDGVFSYGIEPSFGLYFWKRTRISGSYEYYFCVPKLVRDYFEKCGYRIPMESDSIKDTWNGEIGNPIKNFIEIHKEKLNIKFKNSTEINPLDKLDLMSRVMKWIDSSISVTYMLPEKSNWEDVYNFILEAYKREVKSIAAFPDRQMYGIVSYIPFKDLAFKLKNENMEIDQQNFSEEEKIILYGETRSKDSIKKTHAPKRPNTLPCEIHHCTKEGHRYYVVVGMLNKDPYEVFLNSNHDSEGEIIVPKNVKEGLIRKDGRGKYTLVSADKKEYKLTNGNSDENMEAVTRLVSTSLRHGTDISFILHQLEKSKGSFKSLIKVLSQVLKKYIKDGTIVSGEKCPNCGNEKLNRNEGCISCLECGYSKC